MKRYIRSLDGITRLIGGLTLIAAGVLSLPFFLNRTSVTFILWVSFITGFVAFVGAIGGKCSWYAGTYILITSYLLFLLRFSNLNFFAAVLAIGVGTSAFFLKLNNKCVDRSLFRLKK